MSLDPWHLLLSFLISTVGLGVFLYGKRIPDPKFLLVGMGMMGSTYFISSIPVLLGVTGLFTAILFSDSIQARLGEKKKPRQIKSI